MMRINTDKRYLIRLGFFLLLALTGCVGNATDRPNAPDQPSGAVGPQQITNATEVIKFDPASIAVSGDSATGTCAESSLVPGTYRCLPEAGQPAEPCFAQGGTRLICRPDPVAGSYAALISAAAPLPSVPPPSIDRAVIFFVELDSGQTCAIRAAAEPVVLDAGTAGYECATPYTYLVGDATTAFDDSAPHWMTTVYTLDPATGGAATGVAVGVRRAWIP